MTVATLKITPVEGKPTADGGWAVKPLWMREGQKPWEEARGRLLRGTTFVRARDRKALEKLRHKLFFRGALVGHDRVDEEDERGRSTAPLADVFRVPFDVAADRSYSPPRMVVREYLEVPADGTPVSFDIRQARWLLDPKTWGLVFEECLQDGTVPGEVEATDEKPKKPKKPGGR